MSNIDPDMCKYQAKVMEKYNLHYPFAQQLTQYDHGTSFDLMMQQALQVEKQNPGPVVVMFMDIDCVPLSPKALDYYIEKAWNGTLIGNAQRSNHIQNGQHLYAGSPCVALSLETYKKMGAPSARPTSRGDVAEEWTYKAEEHNIPVELVMPVRFDAPPIRMSWETDTRPYWPLKDGDEAHHYGIGTTYQIPGIEGDAMWHMFQSFHPGQLERFIMKCKEIVGE